MTKIPDIVAVLLLPLLLTACGGEGTATEPAPSETTKILREQWDAATEADIAITCQSFEEFPDTSAKAYAGGVYGLTHDETDLLDVDDVRAFFEDLCA